MRQILLLTLVCALASCEAATHKGTFPDGGGGGGGGGNGSQPDAPGPGWDALSGACLAACSDTALADSAKQDTAAPPETAAPSDTAAPFDAPVAGTDAAASDGSAGAADAAPSDGTGLDTLPEAVAEVADACICPPDTASGGKPAPNFTLQDLNPNSATYQKDVSYGDFVGFAVVVAFHAAH